VIERGAKAEGPAGTRDEEAIAPVAETCGESPVASQKVTRARQVGDGGDGPTWSVEVRWDEFPTSGLAAPRDRSIVLALNEELNPTTLVERLPKG
jgi:hypothetical protein